MSDKKLIYTKMSAVMKDIGPVTKDQTNSHQKYKFRGIDQFVNALHPALVRHGVILVPEVLERTEQIVEVTRSNGNAGIDKHVSLRVRYTFFAEDGSSVSTVLTGEGVDSGDKATNKALSAALKYALIQTFAVPTEDMVDGDSDSPEIGRKKSSVKAGTTNTFGTPNPPAVEATTEKTEAPTAKVSSFRKTKKEEPKTEAPVEKAANGNGTGDDWL